MQSLPPEKFNLWSLFKVYVGVQKYVEMRFLQHHHDGLKAIVQVIIICYQNLPFRKHLKFVQPAMTKLGMFV